jgi:trehalose synthase
MGPILKDELGVHTIWRCHIGLDEHLPATRAAWHFLQPYAETYDQVIFSAPEYIPDYLAGCSTIVHPGIDPESHKNRMLSPHKLVGILCNAGLKQERHPVLTPPFPNPALRLTADGSLVPATDSEEIGLLYRPIVTQISRWDRLKGFDNVLSGFIRLKERLKDGRDTRPERYQRLLEIVRLVLAGPDPSAMQDDPEAREVFQEIATAYQKLPAEYQKDVAVLVLPMDSRKENALMVNALQRCSTVVVQNSIREGFGLPVTEAMWKRVPLIGTHACGLRQQIRDGIDGLLIRDPRDPDELAWALEELLKDPVKRHVMARTAQRRVHEEFLIFTQLRRWLRLLAACASAPIRRTVG